MSRILSITVTIALAAAAVALQAAHWGYSRAYGPFAEHGATGQTITTPHYSVEVERVESARSVRVPGDRFKKAELVPAGGVFVIVIATLEARRSTVYAADARLSTRYGDYKFTDKFGGGLLTGPTVKTLGYVALQPGMPRRGAYIFDVPAGALAGARFVLSDRDPQPANFGYYRRDPVRFSQEVDIDLGVGPARARGLLATAPASYKIPAPS